MAATKYTYLVSTDFTGLTEATPELSSLENEIRASAIVTAVDYINMTANESVDIWFKAALSSEDEAVLDGVVAAHTGVSDEAAGTQAVKFLPSQTPLTQDGRLRIGMEKSTQSKVQFYSHDWCDKTTWYEDATRVEDEAAVDSGDHTTYELANANIIDTYHAKITEEDFLSDADENSFRVTVKVDSVGKTEQDPHTATGGDYTVDYPTGEITFLSALTGTETVEVTYHHATTALFTIRPGAGKNLTLEMVEVQFSDDVEITDSLRFQPYGLVEVFAPSLTPTPFPAGTLLPLGNPLIYKSMRDYFNDAQRAFPSYPALGGAGWRGVPRASYILDWDYLRGTLLEASKGMEIRVTLDHDQKFGGAFATATFYCSSEDG